MCACNIPTKFNNGYMGHFDDYMGNLIHAMLDNKCIKLPIWYFLCYSVSRTSPQVSILSPK